MANNSDRLDNAPSKQGLFKFSGYLSCLGTKLSLRVNLVRICTFALSMVCNVYLYIQACGSVNSKANAPLPVMPGSIVE